MDQVGNGRIKGIANLFDRNELKNFIVTYLIMMGVVEGLIFFASFVIHLSSENQPFPWKPYVFASFITPVAITFIFGVFAMAFNKFLYETAETEANTSLSRDSLAGGGRLNTMFYLLRQLPFLFGLLLLVLVALAVYNVEEILLFIGHAGEQAARYLLITAATLLVVFTLLALIWMVLSYRLRKKRMEYEFQYRRDVMERTGMILLENDRVIDQSGNELPGGSAPPALPPRNYRSDDDDLSLISDIRPD